MLDNELLNQSGIHPNMDNSHEKLGSSEQEEETQWSEVSISRIDPSVNFDPFPLSPYKYETPLANEHQKESKSPGHT